MSLLDQLAAPGPDQSVDQRVAAELESIQARFRKAAEELKSARFPNPDGRPRSIEELPWYVMIGAPGSGKTTALLNSGLRFPLYTSNTSASVPGVGGKINCNWWFADQARVLGS